MATTITDVLMTSDQTPHAARWEPNGLGHHQGAWLVSWLPGYSLRRNQAVTAMTLAEMATTGALLLTSRLVEDWAGELGLTAQQAVDLLTAVV